jgi:hypothetical protein
MLTIFDPHIGHGGYMSVGHVSSDLDLSKFKSIDRENEVKQHMPV